MIDQLKRIEATLDDLTDFKTRPSVWLKPTLQLFVNVTDASDRWKAVYGDLCGSGSTPAEAMEDFDNAFNEQ